MDFGLINNWLIVKKLKQKKDLFFATAFIRRCGAVELIAVPLFLPGFPTKANCSVCCSEIAVWRENIVSGCLSMLENLLRVGAANSC